MPLPAFSKCRRISNRPWPEVVNHVLFDHDGTLSALRVGWEEVMEETMLTCILGEDYRIQPPAYLDVMRESIREYISKSTGIQTIVQMVELRERVKVAGKCDLRTPEEYKAIYNKKLMDMMVHKVLSLEQGQSSPREFAIPGAIKLVETLHRQKVNLLLFSGTDHVDVVREANAMGYGSLFNNIYGSFGKVDYEVKREILTGLFRELGHSHDVVVIGDGPVEIEEGRKVGAFCIGVCSDERRLNGEWNPAKEARLIAAGADVLIPSFE